MTTPSPETCVYALEWAIRVLALAIVPVRRTPAASAGWLLLLLFLPIPGLLLFLAIGYPRFPSWRHRRFKTVHRYFQSVGEHLDAVRVQSGEQNALAETLGGLPATAGNGIELIDDYDRTIERLCADIDMAQERVSILVYIFASDETGQRVANALACAHARGVRCRVMFDPVGSSRWRGRSMTMLREAGVEVREALPMRWLRGRTRRDMRNHRKLVVIDGRIAYAGSQNIVAKDFRRGVVNQELVARVTGPVVATIDACITGDWHLETEQPLDLPDVPPVDGTAVMQLLPSGADYAFEGFEALLVWHIHRARRRVILVTPYFIPDEDVVGAMRTAVARGVEVDLIVSEVVDQRIVNLAQSSYYDDLLRGGVRIHRYRDRLLHAKAVRIDTMLGIVGSSNVDLRSFQLNAEASLLLEDETSIAALAMVLERYLASSDRLTLEVWQGRRRARRVAENIARLMSPLL